MAALTVCIRPSSTSQHPWPIVIQITCDRLPRWTNLTNKHQINHKTFWTLPAVLQEARHWEETLGKLQRQAASKAAKSRAQTEKLIWWKGCYPDSCNMLGTLPWRFVIHLSENIGYIFDLQHGCSDGNSSEMLGGALQRTDVTYFVILQARPLDDNHHDWHSCVYSLSQLSLIINVKHSLEKSWYFNLTSHTHEDQHVLY